MRSKGFWRSTAIRSPSGRQRLTSSTNQRCQRRLQGLRRSGTGVSKVGSGSGAAATATTSSGRNTAVVSPTSEPRELPTTTAGCPTICSRKHCSCRLQRRLSSLPPG